MAVCTFLTITSLRAAGTPAGWTVAAPAFDLSLNGLSDTELIDKLQLLDMARLNRPMRDKLNIEFSFLGESIDLSAPDGSVRIWSPELRELVRRGVAALPALLEHVSDARPSRLVFAIPRIRKANTPATIALGDEYDSRALPTKNGDGVNTSAHASTPAEQGYIVKLGDLCYVAIGQIVNRRLFVFSYTNAGFDEHGRYKNAFVMNGRPFGFGFIDSPVETPAIAAAVRSDWRDLDAQAHVNSLRADASSGRNTAAALCRLLAYYPAEGADAVHNVLSRLVAEPGERRYWLIDQTLSAVSSFWWNDFAKDLESLRRTALEQDRQFLSFEDSKKNPLVNGTAPVLATCADLLAHRADDTQLRSMLTEVVDRLRQQRVDYGGDGSSAFDYHVRRCESVLRKLNGEPEAKPSPREELVAKLAPSTVKVTVSSRELSGMRGPLFGLRFGVTGVSQAEMVAARIRITNAVDDTGFDLTPSSVPSFVHPSVGRTNDAVLTRNEPPSLDVSFNAPPGIAKRLVNVKGYVEMVVPEYDPASMVKIERVAATTGGPVSPPALAEARVTVTVFDANTCNDALAGTVANAKGPQEYGAQPRFKGAIPKGAPPGMFKEPTITDSDIAVGLDDPDDRVVATEFVAADGTPLHYNHNGWYHASGTNGRRFDVYRLERTDVETATMILQLATGNALIRAPFDFSDVLLPENIR